MDEKHLATTFQFTGTGLDDELIVPLGDKGLDGQASCRRGGNDGEVTHAGHCHVEGTRDRGSGQGQDVHFRAQGLEAFLLANTETMFLVDDDQPQVFIFHFRLQQFVCADHDVDLSFIQFPDDLVLFFPGAEARE